MLTPEVMRMSSLLYRFLWLTFGVVILSLARADARELVILSTPAMEARVYIVIVQPTRWVCPWYGVPSVLFVREVTVVSVVPSDRRVIRMDGWRRYRWRSSIVTCRRWWRYRSLERWVYPNSRTVPMGSRPARGRWKWR